MITLSLCMIVKNEEKVIGRCLESVKNMVDEIIIVDTGSTDRTPEICSQYTKHIHKFTWIDDFSAARNFAFQHATMDYVLTMDADDVFLEVDRLQFMKLKKTLSPDVDAVSLKYLAGFDDSGNVQVSLRQIRIVKRERQLIWKGAVHEYIEVEGNILHSDIAVTHKRVNRNSDRNLKIYENRLRNGTPFSIRDFFYYANELFDHGRHIDAIEYYQKFLQSQSGWIEDIIQAIGKISDCYAQIGNIDKAMSYAMQAFQWGPPRAEFCCRLGFLYQRQNRPETAIGWFHSASKLPAVDYGGVVHHACSTWIPNLQLGICYYQLGDYQKAYEYTNIALSCCPKNKMILNNQLLLQKLITK